MQVGNSLLLSEKFHKLSSGAQHLYFCMAMESGGKRDFLFPQASAKKYGIAPSSFDRYKKELLAAGCVHLKSSGRITREANEYCFSIDAFKDA